MVDLTLAEYAERRGVSAQRARVLASQGAINARKVGSQWLVADDGAVRSARGAGRPPSVETVWTAALALEQGNLDGARGPQRRRAAKRVLQRLAAAEAGPSRVLAVATLFANRGALHHVRAADLVELAGDQRVARSGLAWSLSPIQSVDDIDLYVRESAWEDLQLDHALVEVPPSRANARVRVVPDDVDLAHDAPALIAAADLADIGSPRAQVAATEITASIDLQRP
jgi:hypothetical protein